MPERGGPTAQSGILYQNSVAALYLGRLCDNVARPQADLIVGLRVEAPGDVDDIVLTYVGGRVVYVQAKEAVEQGRLVWRELWGHFAAQYRSPSFMVGRDRLRLHVGESYTWLSQLRELCERARTSGSPAEWLGRLTQDQERLVRTIEPFLQPAILAGDETLHGLFAHVEVEPPRVLADIERDLVPLWMPATNLPAHTVFRLLRDRVGGEARRRGLFEAQPLRAMLTADDGVAFRDTPDLRVLRAAVRDCGALLRQHKSILGYTGVHVERAVVDEITTWAQDAPQDQAVGLLLDHAGRGKTVVMRDVMLALEARDITVLAIKADQQLAGVEDAAALRRRLNLPEPVERVAGLLATEGRVVVIVDQLDALSLTLARDQRGLDTTLGVVALLRTIPGVMVLMSCRTFDRHTDPRLKSMQVGREFSLPLLSDAEVAAVLAQLGLEAATLTAATRELLRTPLHLDLFASLVAIPGGDPIRRQGVRSLQGLYDLLWEEIILRPDPTGPSPVEREQVLRAMTERMAREQRTSVPRSLFGSDAASAGPAADWLASTGILVRSPTEWTFLHQTFFDYCYARFFVEDGRQLTDTVLESDQGLFSRPQVVQVLAYLRGTGHHAYTRELSRLLWASGLRFHLRDLVFRWVGALAEATEAEWVLVQRLLVDPAMRTRALRAMAGNPVWFERLKSGLLPGLLAGDTSFIDAEIVPYLASLVDHKDSQAAIAILVRPWLQREEPWPSRARSIAQRIRSWTADEAVALYEEVLAGLPIDQLRHAFEIDDIAEANPTAGARIFRLVLDRILDAFLGRGSETRTQVRGLADDLEILNGGAVQKALTVVSSAEPATFLTAMVPWLERAVEGYALTDTGSREWYHAPDPMGAAFSMVGPVVHHVLMEAYVSALVGLARSDLEAFHTVARRLAGSAYVTPQLVLARTYREAAQIGHDDAVDFLLADPRRLRLGENHAFESRMLLRAIGPYLTADQLVALERLILTHAGAISLWYGGLESLRWRGIDQLHLLRELPHERLSNAGSRRLAELERKFPGAVTIDRPTTMEGGWVGPPISPSAASRMSDAAWLRAMKKYGHGVTHRQFLRGGARELARLLQAEARDDPERFAELAAHTPGDLDDAYAEALIQGLAESVCSPELVYGVVRRFALAGRPEIRRTTAWALGKLIDRAKALPSDLVALLGAWVRAAPGPDEVWWEAQNQDLSNAAINTDRGAALRTLLQALASQGDDGALGARWEWLEYVIGDPSVVLRAGAMLELIPLLGVDRDRAIGTFERLARGYPRLRKTYSFQEFLYYGSFGQFERLGRYMQELMQDDDPAVRQRGAELVTLSLLSSRGLESESARSLADLLGEQAITGSAEWRRGVARIYAHNLADGPTGICADGLRRLFDDGEDSVCREVAWMVFGLRPDHVVSLREFLLAFAGSRSARTGLHRFGEYLWQHGLLDSVWALTVVERILDSQGPNDGYPGLGGGEELVRLVLRIYTDPTSDNALREQAMTIFDRLIERFSGYALAALAEWDRG